MKNIILALVLLAGVSCASAQDVYTSSGKPGYHKKTKKQKGYDPSKLIIGGGLNASLGDGYASAGISPMVGYRFTERFMAGVGLGYQYYQAPDWYFSTQYATVYDKENIIFPSIWGKFIVWRNLYVASTLEYDFIKLQQPDVDYNGNPVTDKLNVNAVCLLIGPGIRFPLGGRVALYGELMYDILQQPYSPYYGQIVPHIGFSVGL